MTGSGGNSDIRSGDYEEQENNFWVTVSQITSSIKRCLEDGIRPLWIKGELSNVKFHRPSGHLYFSMKDESALLRCVMFKRNVFSLFFEPSDGEEVIAFGRITVYGRHGQYQLVAEELVPAGTKGIAAIELEKLKRKLVAEGLFAVERKKALPQFPRVVGVVTSSTGAAIRDIVRVSRRRWPGVRILLCSAQVQGEDAPGALVRAIERQNEANIAQILIVGRGGGAQEDLSAFNDEMVVRAIVASHIPIVSAVGHETDITLADLAADARAPTPSAAAELVVPDIKDVLAQVSVLENRITRVIRSRIALVKEQLSRYRSSHGLMRPRFGIQELSLRLDDISHRLRSAVANLCIDTRTRLSGKRERLESLDPRSILKRGYTMCTDAQSDTLIARVRQLEDDHTIHVRFYDGVRSCRTIPEENPNQPD